MNGLHDFVMGGFPLPQNPVWATGVSLGEFVAGGFPLPQNPVGIRASANGSLPKAPPMPMALIGHGNGADLDCGSTCGCGGSCGACGMGGLGDTIIPQASLPSFLQGAAYIPGVPTLYLAGGLALAFLFFRSSTARGRR